MILVGGLTVLAFVFTMVGSTVLFWMKTNHPGVERLFQSGHSEEEVQRIMVVIVCVGLFLFICASYIWSHP